MRCPSHPWATGLIFKAQGYRTSQDIVGSGFFWVIGALSALTVWMLLGSWRHMRRRAQIQGELVQETNFRRAMENSMLTGMRAMDLEGRITYVNAAFCGDDGFRPRASSSAALPPFPYWPARSRPAENARLLQHELQGRSPAGRHSRSRCMRKRRQRCSTPACTSRR
jgi:PAS domain-containing protein